jgi:glycosyltransferase involved in cell wall biosynthesis
MRIAIVAPFEETVPPQGYGGTEQMVHLITEGLVARGHDVTLFATGGSVTSAKLVPVFDRSLRQDPEIIGDMAKREAYKFIGEGRVLEHLQSGGFDIIHSHISWRLLPFHSLVPTPIVTTLHFSLEHDTIKGRHVPCLYPTEPYISISDAQRRNAPGLNYVATVHNGIDTDEFEPGYDPEDYLVFLGRMSPEKGPREAIEVAQKVGIPLKMAAKLDDADREYFAREIEPMIDGTHIQFVGEVNHAQKEELLSRALALVAPIQWDEPFGLYFVEALACGTPVLAMNRGSAPEIITHGETGFLGNSITELARLIDRVPQLDRHAARRRAVEHFHFTRMVDGYETAYRTIRVQAFR